MFIVKNKTGEVMAIATQLKDAVAMADAAQLDKTHYIVQEYIDSSEQREIYKAYYKTGS